jgi:4-hydroxyproline epimerase
LQPGRVAIETPVGDVSAESHGNGFATVRNVPSYRHAKDVTVQVDGHGPVTGDIAWGGNWFFLTELVDPPLDFARRADLLAATTAIRDALVAADITGAGGEMIDHVELYGPPTRTDADSRNFVLCPGTAYDRSPCGTGTSAKLAALHAHRRLALGQKWRQESIVGSLFTGWLERDGDVLVPRIQGRAFVTGRTTLLFDPDDPFVHGIG